MDYTDIEKIKKIISSSIFDRIFYWKNIIIRLTELKTSIEKQEETEEKINVLEKEHYDLKSEHKAELKISENLKTKIQILENEKEILAPLKIKNIELTNELNKMKQEENTKNTIRDSQIAQYEQFENNARERERKAIELKELRDKEKEDLIKRTWQDHELNVNNAIKLICQEESITFIEEWHHDKKPDNVIQICDEYIVFDAKSPGKNQELSNLPNYIKDQVGRLSKYANHKDV